MTHHFQPARDLIGLLVVVLVEALFLHLAAKFLTASPRYLQAVLVAVLGGILSGIVLALIAHPLWGPVLAALTWLAVCATIYNIGLLRSLLLGVLAAVLFVFIRWLILLIAEGLSRRAG